MDDAKSLLQLMVDKGASDLLLTADTRPHIKVDGCTADQIAHSDV